MDLSALIPLEARCQRIDWLVLDVDGVLTAGAITYGAEGGLAGQEIKSFHVRDGSGLNLWHRAGKGSAILTGRSSPIVALRAGELGIGHVVQGAADKGAGLRRLLTEKDLSPASVCYIGDDLPDVPALAQVGLAVAVGDACPEARAIAHLVTRARGGCGAVRETIERILRCQGAWPATLA